MSVTLSVATRYSFSDGHSFGDAGAYEYLAGRAHFAVDPKAPDLQAVTDLGLAPVDKDGKVVFSADFALLKPVDLKRGNKRLFFDYGNRGNKRALQFFNDAPASNTPLAPAHAGNGFLMRRGYAVAWLGWQGDQLPGEDRLRLDAPVATDGGRPITGTVRLEYMASGPGIQVIPLSGLAPARSYPAASLDPRDARLTRRRYAASRREEIGPDFKLLTPGIRPAWAATGDQKRIMTPSEAVECGADYLVIGRPITGAANPADAAQKIAEELAGL